MNELEFKRKRVEPLIRIRQNQLDKESLELMSIRREKVAAINTLREQQNQYSLGLQQINRLRQSSDPSNLNSMDRGLDYVKNKCYEILTQIRIIEQKERAQLEMLYLAQRNVKSMESLKERYNDQLKEVIKKEEQKMSDEFAVNRFATERK